MGVAGCKYRRADPAAEQRQRRLAAPATMTRREWGAMGARRAYAASQVDADPCTRVHARFRVSGTEFHSVGAAPERKNAHNARLCAREQFKRGSVRIWRSTRAIQDVDRMSDSIIPKCDGEAARDEGQTRQHHDGADGLLSDAV
eukprot:1355285-Pleurochrysis_carterae.AAC.4